MASSLQTLTVDGNTDGVTSNSGNMIVIVTGTFGGGTATVQIQDEAGTWVSIPGLSDTTAFTYVVTCGRLPLRVNLASSTSPDLDVSMVPTRTRRQ